MTRDDIIKALEWSPRLVERDENSLLARVERVVAQAVAAEREACAKVCEQMRVGIDAFGSIDYHVELTRDMCADAIRARWQA